MSNIPRLIPPPLPSPLSSTDRKLMIPDSASEEEVAQTASEETKETAAKILQNKKESLKCQDNMRKLRDLSAKHQAFIDKCKGSHGQLVLIKCNIKEKEEEQYYFLGEYRTDEGLDVPTCENVKKYQKFDKMLMDYNPIMNVRLFKDEGSNIKSIYLKGFKDDAAMKEAIIPLNEAFMYENITPTTIVNYTEQKEEGKFKMEDEAPKREESSESIVHEIDDGMGDDTDDEFEDVETESEGEEEFIGGKKKKKKRRKSRTKKKKRKRRNSTRKIV